MSTKEDWRKRQTVALESLGLSHALASQSVDMAIQAFGAARKEMIRVTDMHDDKEVRLISLALTGILSEVWVSRCQTVLLEAVMIASFRRGNINSFIKVMTDEEKEGVQ